MIPARDSPRIASTPKSSGLRPASGVRRPEVGVEALVLLGSLFLLIASNGPFWRAVLDGQSPTDPATWRFLGATFALLAALNFLVIALVATPRIVRPLLAVALVASALASYYIDRYGIVLDPSMLRNVLRTDLREARELLGLDIFRSVALPGLLPAALLWAVRLRERPLLQSLAVRAAALAISLVVAVAALLVAFKDFGSLMRDQHTLRYLITPGNIAWSLGRVIAGDARAATLRRDSREPATRGLAADADRKPTLLVIVLGESARAANFSLNGYARSTTPELSRLDVVNFPHTTSCGTSTEVSVPCMFSSFGRADYDEERIRRHDTFLHIAARAGIRVVWLDNQSGCKGVCDGLEFHDMNREPVAELCPGGRCFDSVLLHALGRVVGGASGDLVVVLHQLGNHGPAYFRRYPEEAKRFTPACEKNDLRACTREEVVNAYDNAIAYTDRLLGQTIRFLEGQRARFDVAMLYVSDHGESLGEHGLYLHGMPHAIAPREQTEVPMLWWMPRDASEGLGIDLACFRGKTGGRASHDNLFHSVLGMLSVDTPSYRHERDLFDGCRTVPRAGEAYALAPASIMAGDNEGWNHETSAYNAARRQP